jgi:hypothetical protein
MMHAPLAARRPFFAWWRAALSVCWGAWVALPGMHTFENSRAWQPFTQTAPEEFWGLLMLAAGLGHLVGVWRRFAPLRAACVLCTGALWLTFAAGFFLAMPTGTTWITYSFLAAANFQAWLVLAGWAPRWWPAVLP